MAITLSEDNLLEGSQHGHQQGWVAKDIHHQTMLAIGSQHSEKGKKHLQEPKVLLQNENMCLFTFVAEFTISCCLDA